MNPHRCHTQLGAICLIILCLTGCDPNSATSKKQGSDQNNKTSLMVVATTGHIHDALQRITAGTGVQIDLFCGPGVDPHSFSASTRDVQAMVDADLIIYNGFHLEARLDEHLHDTFADKSWAMASAFPEMSRLDWVEDGEIDPDAPFDPHIWNHLPGWAKCVQALAERLATADPDHSDAYLQNAADYIQEINETHQWASEMLSSLPEDRRIIVSAHDAFGYFARNYGMTTSAPLGVGNDAEADIKAMKQVADSICNQKIPAIFLETITSPKVTQALSEACSARGWEVKIVQQPLYSDALGEQAPLDTFLGAFRSNVEVIHASLSQ